MKTAQLCKIDQHRIAIEDIYKLPLVLITGEDHVSNDVTTLTFQTVGWLLFHDKKETIIISWLPIVKNDEMIKANWETFCLVSSCIHSIRRLNNGKRIKVKR